MSGLMKVNWSSSRMRALDYGLSAAVMIMGLAFGYQWLFWLGVAGIFFALVNPMGRIQRGIRGFFQSKG